MNNLEAIEDRIKVFWEQQEKFRSHPLQTEMPNPDTYNLSDLAKSDLVSGIKTLQNVDVKAIHKMVDYVPQLTCLREQIKDTLNSGHKIYICGCGASGRLAVALEFLWRNIVPEEQKNSVVGFLAGGDNAMIKSLEGFEDHKSFGIKQLYQAGFKDGYLLLSATASGESPFVIAAAEEAAKTSVKPWFIHCNTNEALKGRIKDHVIYNDKVNILSLFVGPMALTGSTRMQATTALMLGIALPLLYDDIEEQLNNLESKINNLDLSGLAELIECEANIYKNSEYVLYNTDPVFGITVLTDTTERAPTFNLAPFENQLNEIKNPSLCYLLFSETDDLQKAWKLLLGRVPRALKWDEDTSIEQLYGFDFSKKIIEYRNRYASPSHIYSIKKINNEISFELDNVKAKFDFSELNPILEQAGLKILLNICSTLIMGRLGHYEGNLMTSLYPSNSKLIDRAIRYIDFLVQMKTDKKISYNDLAENMFEELRVLKPNESIVLNTVKRIINL
ncbi:MAG TPA: SIS domain-containing protein [Victivallales bacterium]|nr:SIS domain-containing protein [Victivallales bacterium]